MAKKLINKMSEELLNMKLNDLREEINKTFFKDNNHNERNIIINQVQTINLSYKEVCSLTAENILFYLNYNTKFALMNFKECSYGKRLLVLDKLLTIDLSDRANLVHYADFLIWSVNYLYRDEDMAKLVKYFCDNTNYKNSRLIFDIYNVYSRIIDDSKCKRIIMKKQKETEKITKKIREDIFNSKIIF